MAYPKVYQPELQPFLIKALHHQARHLRVPMTRLLNEIVTHALAKSEGMRSARKEIESQPGTIAGN